MQNFRDMAANGTGAARALRGLNPVMPKAKPPAPPAVAQKQIGFGGFLKKRDIVETPTGLSYNEPRESAARQNVPRRADCSSQKIHGTAVRGTAAEKKITRGHRKKSRQLAEYFAPVPSLSRLVTPCGAP